MVLIGNQCTLCVAMHGVVHHVDFHVMAQGRARHLELRKLERLIHRRIARNSKD